MHIQIMLRLYKMAHVGIRVLTVGHLCQLQCPASLESSYIMNSSSYKYFSHPFHFTAEISRTYIDSRNLPTYFGPL